MNKLEMDQQLIESCILEKWNPIALGCDVGWTESHSCVLCQVYNNSTSLRLRRLGRACEGCPVWKKTKKDLCKRTPFDYCYPENYHGIEDEIEFLISLLPKKHQWRNE